MDPLSKYMLLEILAGIPLLLLLIWLSKKYPPKD